MKRFVGRGLAALHWNRCGIISMLLWPVHKGDYRTMLFSPVRCLRTLTLCALISTSVFSGRLFAQTHVVSPADLHQEVVNASQARHQRVDQVTNFLSSDKAKQAL